MLEGAEPKTPCRKRKMQTVVRLCAFPTGSCINANKTYPRRSGRFRPNRSLSGLHHSVSGRNPSSRSGEAAYPNTIGPHAKPSMKMLVVAPTMTSTFWSNSAAITLVAAPKTLDANVVESTCSAMEKVSAHFRLAGEFCGCPGSEAPYQSTTKLGEFWMCATTRSSKAESSSFGGLEDAGGEGGILLLLWPLAVVWVATLSV